MSTINLSGPNVTYGASPGELNDLVIAESAGTLTFFDAGATITPGAGAWTIISPNEVSISSAGITGITINLGDQDDQLDASGVGAASGLQSLNINGQAGDDTLIGSQVRDLFSINGTSPGADSIDGQGSANDLLNIGVDADMTLTNSTLTIGSATGSFANLEQVNFFGGPSDNILDASAVTATSGFNSVSINGQDGNDTITGSQLNDIITISGATPGVDNIDGQGNGGDLLNIGVDADMTLTDTTLSIGLASGTHTNMERVNFFGGPSDNVLDASGVTAASGFTAVVIDGRDGNDTITGSQIGDIINIAGAAPGADSIDGQGGSNDLLNIGVDADMALTDTTLVINTNTTTHVNMENVNFNGGNSDNILDASGVTTATSFSFVNIDGRAGNDTITGSQIGDIITMGGSNPGADIIDAQGSNDDLLNIVVDADLTFTDNSLTIGGLVSSHTNIELTNLIAGAGDNTIDASGLTSASGMSQVAINGRGGSDEIRLGSLTIPHLINGDSGFDTLDLTGADLSPNVVVNGTGTVDGDTGNFALSGSFDNIDEIVLPAEYDFTSATFATPEGNAANFTTVVQVTRSVNTSLPSSVKVVLNGNTATAGTDFTDGPISINFAPGEVSKNVDIELLGDTNVETDETIDLAFSDGIAGSINPISTLTIVNDDASNQAPQITSAVTDATMQSKATPGVTVSFVAQFSDADALDTHSATIDWGDGTTSIGVVDEQAGTITGIHSYSTGGIFAIAATVTDNSGADDQATTTAIVTGVRLTDAGTVQIVGSDGRDRIHAFLSWHQAVLHVHTRLNGHNVLRHYDPSDVNSFQIVTCQGNDHIHLGWHLNIPAEIDAGAGNDWIRSGSGDDQILAGAGRDRVWAGRGNDEIWAGDNNDWIGGGDGDDLIRGGAGHDDIQGGRGNDIVLGGSGHDWLDGGSDRDIVIGGIGHDYLSGWSAEDILISGTTDHDAVNSSLRVLLTAWSSPDSYEDRVDSIRAGSGNLSGIALIAGATVHDDMDHDILKGRQGRDWFFADIDGLDSDDDCIWDAQANEEIDQL